MFNESSFSVFLAGVVGGGGHADKGNGANHLCLATDPDLGPLSTENNAHIYGTEYHFLSMHNCAQNVTLVSLPIVKTIYRVKINWGNIKT